jgi:hypothetical protein
LNQLPGRPATWARPLAPTPSAPQKDQPLPAKKAKYNEVALEY